LNAHGIKRSRISIPGVFAKLTENTPAPTRWYTDTANKNAADPRTPANQALSPGNISPASSSLEVRLGLGFSKVLCCIVLMQSSG
jgi:hypothetical protein